MGRVHPSVIPTAPSPATPTPHLPSYPRLPRVSRREQHRRRIPNHLPALPAPSPVVPATEREPNPARSTKPSSDLPPHIRGAPRDIAPITTSAESISAKLSAPSIARATGGDGRLHSIARLAQSARVPAAPTDCAKAAGRSGGRPSVVPSPAFDRAAPCADRASVAITSADGNESSSGHGADCDLRAAQPATYASVGREVAGARRDALPIRWRESELDPAVGQHPRVDVADRDSLYLYGGAGQPALVLNVGGEIAACEQHALSVGGLPAGLGTSIGKTAGDEPDCLLVTLRGCAR